MTEDSFSITFFNEKKPVVHSHKGAYCFLFTFFLLCLHKSLHPIYLLMYQPDIYACTLFFRAIHLIFKCKFMLKTKAVCNKSRHDPFNRITIPVEKC